MNRQPVQPEIASPAAPASEVATSFLADWRPDHRELPDAGRIAAGLYIDAIVRRAAFSDGAAEGAARIELWSHFRRFYDDLLGPYSRGQADDVRRAICRL